MAYTGRGQAGTVYTGTSNTPKFQPIGTDSGLTAHSVVIAEGNSAFTVATPGAAGTILMSNGPGSDPTFQPGGSMVPNTLTGQSGGALSPTLGNFNIYGATVSAGTSPVATSGSGSTITTNVQISQAIAAADATKIGLSNFDSSSFAVAATGFVTLSTTGAGKTITGDSGGALSPTANNWNILGGTVAAGTSPIKTAGSGSTLTINAQISQAIASTDATKIGLSNYNSAQFSVDANGFVTLAGASTAPILGIVPDAHTAPGTTPVIPNGSGNITLSGSTVAAGTTPIQTNSLAANTIAIQVQKSQAIAATDATKIGLCNFDSAKFSVDANGFVTTSGTGVANTITGDSGGALSPTAGNWNILGLSGSKTSGSGSTLTIKSPPFSQVGASATSSLNTGEFVTAAVTRTLPATGGLADGDLIIFYCTSASTLTITANTGQTIRVGASVSSSAGSCASNAIGDSISLRFDATAVSWRAISVIGTWTLS